MDVSPTRIFPLNRFIYYLMPCKGRSGKTLKYSINRPHFLPSTRPRMPIDCFDSVGCWSHSIVPRSKRGSPNRLLRVGGLVDRYVPHSDNNESIFFLHKTQPAKIEDLTS